MCYKSGSGPQGYKVLVYFSIFYPRTDVRGSFLFSPVRGELFFAFGAGVSADLVMLVLGIPKSTGQWFLEGIIPVYDSVTSWARRNLLMSALIVRTWIT